MNKNSILKLSLLVSISLLPSCVTPATNPQVSPSTSVSASPSTDITSGVGNPNATASPDSQTSASPSPSVSPSSNTVITNPVVTASANVSTSTALTIPAEFLSLSYHDYYSAELKWKEISGAKSYRIYQDGKVIADNLSSYIYNVKNLTPNTNYKFDIVAVNEAGESNKSTISMRTFIPSTPTNNNNNNYTPEPVNPRNVSLSNVIFVDQSSTYGANNGTTWNNAYTNLQDALNAATSGKQVWVAKGKYYPSSVFNLYDTNYRALSFDIKSGVKAYGGFLGTELTIDSRTISANTTVLSGDIGRNDNFAPQNFRIKVSNNNYENSYHVVSILGTDTTPNTGSSIDGFTITAGNANGSGAQDHGGGLVIDKASTTISNIIFSGNYGNYGGAIFNANSTNTTITNSTFTGNTSYSPGYGGGGAIYTYSDGPNTSYTMNITNSTFNNNNAGGSGINGNGGAIYNNRFTVNITGSRFTNNSSSNDGGAIYNDTSILNLNRSTFTNNVGSGQWGNGISSDSGSTFNYLQGNNSFTDTTIYPCQDLCD